MSTFLIKIFAIALIIVGETLSVYAEVIAAKNYSLDPANLNLILSKNTVLLTMAGSMLILGYMIGYSAFQNIWIVSVISVTSVLVIEPSLTYFVFEELPGRGAMIGLAFGVIGFLSTLLDERPS